MDRKPASLHMSALALHQLNESTDAARNDATGKEADGTMSLTVSGTTSNGASGSASDLPCPATITAAQVHILAQVQQHRPVDPAPLPAESLPYVHLSGRPLLLLDLDHTLINTALEKPKAGAPDVDFLKLTRRVSATGQRYAPVFVTPRPRLAWFLQEAAKLDFKIGIFTASKRESAEPKIEWLERRLADDADGPGESPSALVFSHRFYHDATTPIYSPHESRHKILHVKDLRTLLPRDDTADLHLARVVLVEDLPAVCGWQPDNVVPIEPWWGAPDDRAFERLLPVLAHVAASSDVRPALRSLLGFAKRASMHVGEGCPAADSPLDRKAPDCGPGPLGCTCTSLYEHKLLVGNFRVRQPSPASCPPGFWTEGKKRGREGSPLAPVVVN